MKFNSMLFLLVMITISVSACNQIQGETICGIWNVEDEFGKMQIEITPWKGEFIGYMLTLDDGQTIEKGAKEDEFIVINGLAYGEENHYKGGKFFFGTEAEEYYPFKVELLNENRLKVSYDFQGEKIESIWQRAGSEEENTTVDKYTEKEEDSVLNKKELAIDSTNETIVKEPSVASKSEKSNDNHTLHSCATFHVIGWQEKVDYSNETMAAQAIEALWTKVYNEDFSGQLNSIIESQNIYVIYSDYDKPTGKMSITVGYQVNSLKTIPENLSGVVIPANDYYVFPLSGEASDFEGEGWEQLGELMNFRSAQSADFEVYTLTPDFEIKQAKMWVASE